MCQRNRNSLGDEVEFKLIEIAIKNKIPILGICRGMQLINIYFGGEISSVSISKHVSKKHMVNFSKAFSEEFRIEPSLMVSSFHSFGISKLAKDSITALYPAKLACEDKISID